MTKQIGYQPTDAQRLAGAQRTINALLRRQQLPLNGATTPYAYVASAGSGTLTHGTTVYWDLSGGASGDPPVTDDDVLFTGATFSSGPATGKGAVQINGPGLYRVEGVIQVIAEELDATLHQRTTQILTEGTASQFAAGFQTGSQNSMLLGYQHFVVLIGIAADGYRRLGFSTANNDGSGAPTGKAFMLIEQKDGRDYSSISLP